MARVQIDRDSEVFDRLARWMEDPDTYKIAFAVQVVDQTDRLDGPPAQPLMLLKRNEDMWSLPLATNVNQEVRP